MRGNHWREALTQYVGSVPSPWAVYRPPVMGDFMPYELGICSFARPLDAVVEDQQREEASALRLIQEAEQIASTATAAGREMTAGEQEAYLRRARGGDAAKARAVVFRSEADDVMREMAAKPGALEGQFGGPNGSAFSDQVRGASGISVPSRPSYGTPVNWGAEFVNHRRERASLLEVGTIPVSTLLSPTPIVDARQAHFVFELCPSPPASGGVFSYLKQTARINNAAVVPKGSLKPTSIYTLKRVDDAVDTIAHLSEPINVADLSDAPLLATFLNGELAFGLSKAIDKVLVDAILLAAFSTHGDVSLTGIRSAITTLQLLDLTPTAIAINPEDWEVVEAQALEAFAAGDAAGVNEAYARRLYSLPVVVSNSIDEGQCIVGDFAGSAAVYRTGGTVITIHDSAPREDGNGGYAADYQFNQVTFRCETRAKPAIGRPLGFVQLSSGS